MMSAHCEAAAARRDAFFERCTSGDLRALVEAVQGRDKKVA